MMNRLLFILVPIVAVGCSNSAGKDITGDFGIELGSTLEESKIQVIKELQDFNPLGIFDQGNRESFKHYKIKPNKPSKLFEKYFVEVGRDGRIGTIRAIAYPQSCKHEKLKLSKVIEQEYSIKPEQGLKTVFRKADAAISIECSSGSGGLIVIYKSFKKKKITKSQQPNNTKGAQFSSSIPKEEVRIVQERLNYLGYGPVALDGEVTNETKDAINVFQRDIEVKADGIFSSQLMDQLFQREQDRVLDSALKLPRSHSNIKLRGYFQVSKFPEPSLKKVFTDSAEAYQFKYAGTPRVKGFVLAYPDNATSMMKNVNGAMKLKFGFLPNEYGLGSNYCAYSKESKKMVYLSCVVGKYLLFVKYPKQRSDTTASLVSFVNAVVNLN